MQIIIDIKNCLECPYLEQKRYYSSDSFEAPSFDWYCKKAHGKKIRGYVEWHEESKVPVPDWCPCLPKTVTAERIKEVAETYHDRLVMAIQGGGTPRPCGCCEKEEISLTCIEHDSRDFSKDLWICTDCYTKIVKYWQENKPKKISPI